MHIMGSASLPRPEALILPLRSLAETHDTCLGTGNREFGHAACASGLGQQYHLTAVIQHIHKKASMMLPIPSPRDSSCSATRTARIPCARPARIPCLSVGCGNFGWERPMHMTSVPVQGNCDLDLNRETELGGLVRSTPLHRMLRLVLLVLASIDFRLRFDGRHSSSHRLSTTPWHNSLLDLTLFLLPSLFYTSSTCSPRPLLHLC
ncbi:hypothetical protein J3F83DRAFT_393862 [Trichoderma novae-zelandiae]